MRLSVCGDVRVRPLSTRIVLFTTCVRHGCCDIDLLLDFACAMSAGWHLPIDGAEIMRTAKGGLAPSRCGDSPNPSPRSWAGLWIRPTVASPDHSKHQ